MSFKSIIKNIVKPLLMPIWRRVWNRIEARIQPLEARIQNIAELQNLEIYSKEKILDKNEASTEVSMEFLDTQIMQSTTNVQFLGIYPFFRFPSVRFSSENESISFQGNMAHIGIIFYKNNSGGIVHITHDNTKSTFDLYAEKPGHFLKEISLENIQTTRVTIKSTGYSNPLADGTEVTILGIYSCKYLSEDIQAKLNDHVVEHPYKSAKLNQLVDVFKWYDDEWLEAMRSLAIDNNSSLPDFLHRKDWEWTQCLYGLVKLGAISPESRALGVGVGWEPISYFLSNHITEVVATDLYDEDSEWSKLGAQEGDPTILSDPDKYAPFPYNRERLRFLRMDGTKLNFPDNSFDFVWTCSSIEHFGGHSAATKSLLEIERVLKPGGIAAVITEYILPDPYTGRHSFYYPEFFNIQCLYAYLIEPLNELSLVQNIDLGMPHYYYEKTCFLPEEAEAPHSGIKKPHIVLNVEGCFFTSIALFFVKGHTIESKENKSTFSLDLM